MKIAVIQLTSVLDYKVNLEKIQGMINEAKFQKAEYIFLPECFYSMSDGSKPSPFLPEDKNEHYENIRKLATDNQVFILGGSAAVREDGVIKNRAFNFDPKGNDLGHYDKMHLFSCDIQKKSGEKKTINESDIYTPGNVPKIINAGEFKIGMGICFDLRYPEMGREYVRQGANLLTYPAAFTVPTGKAHWHTLLRSRAIENQCFVVAPAQWGVHNEKIITYGHSLVIDPWGEILADATEGEKVITCEIDLNRVSEVRKMVKVF